MLPRAQYIGRINQVHNAIRLYNLLYIVLYYKYTPYVRTYVHLNIHFMYIHACNYAGVEDTKNMIGTTTDN